MDTSFRFEEHGGRFQQSPNFQSVPYQYDFPEMPSTSHEQTLPIIIPSRSPSLSLSPTPSPPPLPLAPVSPVKYSASLRFICPSNRDFSVFTLRDLTVDSVNTYESLKEAILSQVGESTVSMSDEFQMAFFRKSEKLWINNDRDVRDALAIMTEGKLTLWCMGKDKQPKLGKRNRGKSDVSAETENQSPTGPPMKKQSTSEGVIRVNKVT